MKNKYILFIVFYLMFATMLLAQRERTAFKHFYFDGEGDGLPTNHVGAVYEDNNGLIWICTDDGLVKYDSYRFVFYQFDANDVHSISNNTIHAFWESKNGRCYVGTKIGFNIFDRKTGKFTRFLHDEKDSSSISHSEVRDILETPEGQILIATMDGINIFNPLNNQFQIAKGKTSPLATFCLLQTHGEKVWAGTENGICLVKNTSLLHFPLLRANNIPVKVNDLFQDSKGVLWVASENGLYIFHPQAEIYEKVGLGTKFKDIKCTSLAEYPKGHLFIGSHKYSLIEFDVIDKKVIRHYEFLAEDRYGLSDPNVRGLTLARRNDLWISTDGGLNIINPYHQKFKVYDNDIVGNSKKNYIWCLYTDARGNTWMNTKKGFYRKRHLADEAIPVALPHHKTQEFVTIPSIWEDRKGNVWTVVNNELVKELNGSGRFVSVLSSSFFNNSNIEKVIVDSASPDLLWLSTSKGVCAFNMGTHSIKWVLPSRYLSNVTDDRTRRIIQQENGDLWFAMEQRLCMYSPFKNEMISYIINPMDTLSLFSSKIEDMVASPNRIYIAGNKSFSYFDIDKKYFVNHTVENNKKMTMTGVAAINLDDKGDVWFVGKGNTARFRPSTNTIKGFITFNLTSGGVKRSSFKRRDGSILFGVKKGIMLIDPKNPPKDSITPFINISEILVFNKTYKSAIAPDYLQEINLNYYENYFTIAFTGFSHIVKSDLRYSIKMEGVNKDWEYLGYQRSVEYENMKPGKYTFHVKANNPDGIESKPLTLAVIIHPPFWETYWFYALITTIISFILYLLYSNRKKTILLKKEKKIAEQHAHYKSQFLANMSHEIRTPMNAIMGLNKLLMDSDLNTTQQEYTEAINVSCESLLWIINDILDQAKIESGNLNIKKVPFDIQTIAKQINTLLRNSIKKKKLQFSIDIDDEIPKTIIGDPIRLFQVLTNLIGNSIKFTKKGFIHLRISLQKQKQNKCILLFEVSDTGIGIPEDKLKQIFQSFEQVGIVDNPNLYGNQGTGLGLSIAKNLIELQSGNIQVESKVGKGSRFYFTLSFGVETHQALKSNHKNERILPENLKILLVEDTPINRFLAIELLKKNLSNVAIETAENGEIALQKISSKAYDLALMDIKMPVMNGLEATKLIRQKEDEYFQNIPILGLTANAIPQQIKECFEVGMNECITKPIDVEELLDKIALHV